MILRGKKSCSVGQLLLALDVSETMTALARRRRDERAAVKPNVTRQLLRAAALTCQVFKVVPVLMPPRLSRAVGNRQKWKLPSQCEGLVYAVVVDQLYLESSISIQRQPTSREHQVDLELVGWR